MPPPEMNIQSPDETLKPLEICPEEISYIMVTSCRLMKYDYICNITWRKAKCKPDAAGRAGKPRIKTPHTD